MTGRKLARRATIHQVAQLAGVSTKTVSRVTNGEPNVSAEVRLRVEQAIGELGYLPMQSASNLATRRSRLLALVYDNPSPGYLLHVQQAARQACEEYGHRLVFHPCDHRDPLLVVQLLRLAADLRLQGMVLVPPLSLDDAVVRALAEAEVPVALLAPARAMADCCSVLLDDEGAAGELTTHLLSLGHRRIGFVRGHAGHEASRARLAGFGRAMQAAGVAVDDALLAEGDFSFESGRAAGAALLDRRQRPSALIAANDDMAAGVMAAAHDRRIAIPGELSVCGFDDTPLAAMLWPPLTTMHQPIREMAYAGARMLLERLRTGQQPSPPEDLHYELVVRDSTAPPAVAETKW